MPFRPLNQACFRSLDWNIVCAPCRGISGTWIFSGAPLKLQSQSLALRAVADSLAACQEELEAETPEQDLRQIPLYRSPAAAGYAAPVFGEDFDYIDVTGQVPQGAEFAVRIQGDSMEPFILDGSTVYVNRDPLSNGDVGIFCVDGEMLCKQYLRDRLGIVYLFSLNRLRSDADVVLPRSSGRTMVCFGRVILQERVGLPGRAGEQPFS